MSVNLAAESAAESLAGAASDAVLASSGISASVASESTSTESGSSAFRMAWQQLMESVPPAFQDDSKSPGSAPAAANLRDADVASSILSASSLAAVGPQLELLHPVEGPPADLGAMSGLSARMHGLRDPSPAMAAVPSPATLAGSRAATAHMGPSSSASFLGEKRDTRSSKDYPWSATAPHVTLPDATLTDASATMQVFHSSAQAAQVLEEFPMRGIQNTQNAVRPVDGGIDPGSAAFRSPSHANSSSDSPASLRVDGMDALESQPHALDRAELTVADSGTGSARVSLAHSDAEGNTAQVSLPAVPDSPRLGANPTGGAQTAAHSTSVRPITPRTSASSKDNTLTNALDVSGASTGSPEAQKVQLSASRYSSQVDLQGRDRAVPSGTSGVLSSRGRSGPVSDESADSFTTADGANPSIVSAPALIPPQAAGSGSPRPQAEAPGKNDVFQSLDAGTGLPSGAWIHASSHHAEAAYLDPAVGWVGVRADLSNGQVHASLVPSSGQAAQFVGGHLDGLSSYLSERHTHPPIVTLSSADFGSSTLASDAGANRQSNAEHDGEASAETGYSRVEVAPRIRHAGQGVEVQAMLGTASATGGLVSVMA